MQAPFSGYSRDKTTHPATAQSNGNKSNNTRMVGYTHDFLELPGKLVKDVVVGNA